MVNVCLESITSEFNLVILVLGRGTDRLLGFVGLQPHLLGKYQSSHRPYSPTTPKSDGIGGIAEMVVF